MARSVSDAARRRGARRRPAATAFPLAPVSGAERPRNTPRRRAARAARRLLVVAAFAVAGFLAYSLVAVPVLERGGREAAPVEAEAAAQPAEAAAQQPSRPESAPQRIPAWAWELHQWHLTPEAERGPRPAEAPSRVPEWYWEWRAWRLQLAVAGS